MTCIPITQVVIFLITIQCFYVDELALLLLVQTFVSAITWYEFGEAILPFMNLFFADINSMYFMEFLWDTNKKVPAKLLPHIKYKVQYSCW